MNILLIRATSIQHTALVISKIKKRFDCKISINVLTHQHAVESLNKWFKKENIIIYPYKKSFWTANLLFGKLKNIQKQKYDLVVIPTENISGVGYENLFSFAFFLFPKKIALCNRQGTLTFLSHKTVALFCIKRFICFFPAVFITSFFMIKWFYKLTKSLWFLKKI